jgi:hypothetical protein
MVMNTDNLLAQARVLILALAAAAAAAVPGRLMRRVPPVATEAWSSTPCSSAQLMRARQSSTSAKNAGKHATATVPK